MKRLASTSIVISVSAITSAYAHPGHGQLDSGSILHYLTSPMHLVMMLAIMGAVMYLYYWRYMKVKR